MKQCTRYGIDLTKKCNWRCKTCFYRYADDFNTKYDKPFDEVKKEIDNSVERGCDHIVAVGWGEPALYPDMIRMIEYCESIGVYSSIITNGSLSIKKYEEMYKKGLNHLHISVHGLDKVLDNISEKKGSGKRQKELIEWLSYSGLPYRTNTTIQLENYKQLPDIASFLIENNVFHMVMLNFLPHYHWNNPDKLREVAVHPRDLKPYIQEASSMLTENMVYQTIRYFPMCHLDEQYRKYVTNALYVLYDPWEWEYGKCGLGEDSFLVEAFKLASGTAYDCKECRECDLAIHCGAWNKFYANGFKDINLQSVKMNDNGYNTLGYLFNQNPINIMRGQI